MIRLIALTSLLTLGTSWPMGAGDPPTRPWTRMIYGAADNDADAPILGFLDDIRDALDDDPGMELVLFLDRSEGYSDDESTLGEDSSGARIYHLHNETVERLDATSHFPGIDGDAEFEVDSPDPRNLGDFIAFCRERFPARNYGLMIYSHADGISMCPDDESGRSMSIPELSDWVDEEASVDFMALELCNMGNIEIAYQWRPGNGGFSTDVLLAIPGAGPPLDADRAFRRIRSEGHAAGAEGELHDPATFTPEAFGALVVEEGRLASARRPREMQRMSSRSCAARDGGGR